MPAPKKKPHTRSTDMEDVEPDTDEIGTTDIQSEICYTEKDYFFAMFPNHLEKEIKELFRDFNKHRKQNSTEQKKEINKTELENTIKEFIHEYTTLKSTITNKLNEFKQSDIVKNLPEGNLKTFKDIRYKLTNWYVACQHAQHKIQYGDTKTNKYIKHTFSFSPAVSSNLQTWANLELNQSIKNIEDTISLKIHSKFTADTNEISQLYEQCINDNQTLIFCKAWRTVLKSNSDLADKHMSKGILLNRQDITPHTPTTTYRKRDLSPSETTYRPTKRHTAPLLITPTYQDGRLSPPILANRSHEDEPRPPTAIPTTHRQIHSTSHYSTQQKTSDTPIYRTKHQYRPRDISPLHSHKHSQRNSSPAHQYNHYRERSSSPEEQLQSPSPHRKTTHRREYYRNRTPSPQYQIPRQQISKKVAFSPPPHTHQERLHLPKHHHSRSIHQQIETSSSESEISQESSTHQNLKWPTAIKIPYIKKVPTNTTQKKPNPSFRNK
jgi:hypothetical protein